MPTVNTFRIFRAQLTKHIFLMSVLFGGCFVLAFYQYSADFVSDDDYKILIKYASYGMYDLVPNEFSVEGLIDWLRINFQIFFNDPHGPAPGIYIGPVYRIFDLIGIPITKFSLMIPATTICALISCVLYLLLLQEGFNIGFAFAGSVIFMLSPFFVHAIRATSSLTILVIPLNQILALLATKNLNLNKRSALFVGLALLHIVLSENLAFLTVPVLICAYIIQDLHWRGELERLKIRIRQLSSKMIWLPATMMFLVTIFFSFLTIIGGVPGKWEWKYGFYRTTLYRLIESNHTYLNLEVLADYLSVYLTILYGESLIVLLPLFLIAAAYLTFTRKITGTLWTFSIIATLVFGLIWYVLFDDINDSSLAMAFCYQANLLLPILIVILYPVKKFYDIGRFKLPAIAVIAVLIISSILADLKIIWHKPTVLNPAVKSSKIIRFWHYGTARPEIGTKGASLLIREILNNRLARDEFDYVSIEANWFAQSMDFYTGLRNTQIFEKKYNAQIDKQPTQFGDLSSYFPNENIHYFQDTLPVLPIRVVLNFQKKESRVDKKVVKQSSCHNYSVYSVVSKDDDPFVQIYVFPPLNEKDSSLTSVYPPTNYDSQSLAKSFSKKYNKLRDFFHGLM